MENTTAWFGLSRPEEKEDVLDFINMVFSCAHCPHDFAALLPKCYRLDLLDPDCHYIAKEGSRIKALVGSYPVTQKVLDETLSIRTIGAVSVHPYARSKGYMKKLMAMAVEDMRKTGVDMSWLGGLRQRYQYYGYECAGQKLNFDVTRINLRHCMGADYQPVCTLHPVKAGDPVIGKIKALYEQSPLHAERPEETYYEVLTTWQQQVLEVRRDGEFAGYVLLSKDGSSVAELKLVEETRENLWDLLAAIIKRPGGPNHLNVPAFSFEHQRIRDLLALCEGCSVHTVENLQVFSFERVIRAFMKLKASVEELPDGALTMELAGEKLAVECEDGQVTVTALEPDEECELKLDHHQAVSLLFGITAPFCAPELPAFARVWFPLPVVLESCDQA